MSRPESHQSGVVRWRVCPTGVTMSCTCSQECLQYTVIFIYLKKKKKLPKASDRIRAPPVLPLVWVLLWRCKNRTSDFSTPSLSTRAVEPAAGVNPLHVCLCLWAEHVPNFIILLNVTNQTAFQFHLARVPCFFTAVLPFTPMWYTHRQSTGVYKIFYILRGKKNPPAKHIFLIYIQRLRLKCSFSYHTKATTRGGWRFQGDLSSCVVESTL